MFDIAPSELMIVALVALVLTGPKDLPRVMRVVGQLMGKGRAIMRQVRGGFDEIVREAEIQEAERKRRADIAANAARHANDDDGAIVGAVGAAQGVAQ